MKNISRVPELVGKVIDIDGTGCKYTRKFASRMHGVFEGYIGMPVFLNEVLQTEPKTKLVVSFAIGGQAIVQRDSRIVVLHKDVIDITPFQMDQTMNDLEGIDTVEELTKTTMSMRIQRRKRYVEHQKDVVLNRNTRFEIETAGGAHGIEDF